MNIIGRYVEWGTDGGAWRIILLIETLLVIPVLAVMMLLLCLSR